MNQVYKAIMLSVGIGFTALGVYSLRDITPLKNNPLEYNPEVRTILELKRDTAILEKQYFDEVNNAPASSKIWSFDDKSKELLTKLNEPPSTKQKTLLSLCEHYDAELNNNTWTNRTWKQYENWNRETKRKNKDNLKYGLLSLGIGLLAISNALRDKK